MPRSNVTDTLKVSSKYKKERMAAIAKLVSQGEYDLYLFQELMVEEDYKVIKKSVPEGFHFTNFEDFNDPSQKCVLQLCLPFCKF